LGCAAGIDDYSWIGIEGARHSGSHLVVDKTERLGCADQSSCDTKVVTLDRKGSADVTSFVHVRDWNAVTKIVMAIVTLGAFASLAGLVLLIRWWYGATGDDVIGNGNGSCQLTNLSAVSNGVGTFAVLQEANCPDSRTSYYTVFIHKGGVPNTVENLVLQYEPGAKHWVTSPAPRLAWSSTSSLNVLAQGYAEEIVKQQPNLGGIRITYSLRRENLWDFLRSGA
jgi:hypothetical protein